MENQQPEFLLKVLSGPHQGAEVVLHQGDTTVGSNLESDVILSDAMISENHLKITIEGSQINISPSEGKKAYVEGTPLREDSLDIQQFQVITLGTTHLVVGPLHETWPHINIPKLQEEEKEESPPTDENESDEETSDDEFQDESEEVSKPTDESSKSNETPSDKTEEGKASTDITSQKPEDEQLRDQLKELVQHKLRSKQWVLGITIGAAVFLLFLLVLVWPSSPAVATQRVMEPEQAQVLVEQSLAEMGLAASLQVTEDDGRVLVQGYVDTNSQKRTVQSVIKQVDPTLVASIWSQENLVSGGQEIMSIFGIPVRISGTSTPGRIKASGYAPDTQGWEKAKKHLFTDVPGLRGVDDEVLTPQQIQKLTFPILSRYELSSKVFIIPERNGVVAKGFLSDSISQVWAQAKPSIEQALGAEIPFKDKVQLTTSAILERIYFDSQIGSITLDGNMSWITLQDGQTFFVGSSLPSGFTVESITRQGVVLKRGKERVTLKTGDR